MVSHLMQPTQQMAKHASSFLRDLTYSAGYKLDVRVLEVECTLEFMALRT
jgi:hypothetical protein